MKIAEMFTTNTNQSQRLRNDEFDMFGLTHPGKKRTENEDHFLACTVHPEVIVHGTSLPSVDQLPLRGEWIALLVLVASSLRSYHAAGSKNEDVFLESLRAAVYEAHHAVRAEALQRQEKKPMATTLTLGIVVWPWLYVVQLGDSRAYYYFDDKLTQLTRDQTVAQELVDQGVMPRERLAASPYRHVLSRAVGGESEEAVPEVTRVRIDRFGSVLLFCSDGLTKHVTDDEIGKTIAAIPRSEDICKTLLDLALDRGGSDNITIVVARRRVATATPA
jgi:protein phosphatase